MTEQKRPSIEWWKAQLTPEKQLLMHVDLAVSQVTDLPEIINGPALAPAVRVACIEDFFVNARLIVEFLTKPTRRKNDQDFSAWDVVPDWLPDSNTAERLRAGVWMLTSKQVVHLSRKRAQDLENLEYTDTSLDGLSKIRTDILRLYEQWDAAKATDGK